MPSTVTPTARRSPCSTTVTTAGSAANRSSTGSGRSAAATTTRSCGAATHRLASPDTSPSSACAICSTSARARSRWRLAVGLGRLPCEPLDEPALGRRADAPDGLQPPGGGCLAKLVWSADSELRRDLEHPLRRDAEIAPEAVELGPDLALELVQLGDRPRLDELAEAGGDSRPDPAQLPNPARADEVVDGSRRLADRRGRAAVRAGAVDVRAGEVEQRREGLEPVCYRRVVQARRGASRRAAGSVPLAAARLVEPEIRDRVDDEVRDGQHPHQAEQRHDRLRAGKRVGQPGRERVEQGAAGA